MDHPEVFRLDWAGQLKTLQVSEEPQVLKLDQAKHTKNEAQMAAFIVARIRSLSNRAHIPIVKDDTPKTLQCQADTKDVTNMTKVEPR